MALATDIRAIGASLYFLPVRLRMPLKFGTEITTEVTFARVRVTVCDRHGKTAHGWGETPLAVQWGWPSTLGYAPRLDAMQQCCIALARAWAGYASFGHPMELGHDFARDLLPGLAREVPSPEPIPHLAALICLSLFDLALHDAYGILHGCDVYSTYNRDFLSRDLADYLKPESPEISFGKRYPQQYLANTPARRMPAWHLVGGLDPLTHDQCTGNEPDDGYPTTLTDWITRDGLNCLKIKLRGNDALWDYQRLLEVGRIAQSQGVQHLSADFNCTVADPAYVLDIIDRLAIEQPATYERLLYVEQPFPYDLDANLIDVRAIARRKPLFLDESAHDWQHVRRGYQLGWNGVALKTCKTQSGALLSLCWAKAHGMSLMVQDLTNAMLAQIPHVQLASHAGTIMGVETNGMQFYPQASQIETRVHPGIYRRQNGCVDLSTLVGPGFGYAVDQISRLLPTPIVEYC